MHGELFFILLILLIVAAFLASVAALYFSPSSSCKCQARLETVPLPNSAVVFQARTQAPITTNRGKFLTSNTQGILHQQDNRLVVLNSNGELEELEELEEQEASDTKSQFVTIVNVKVNNVHAAATATGPQLVVEKNGLQYFLFTITGNKFGVSRTPVSNMFIVA
jgi:hypothetical protein